MAVTASHLTDGASTTNSTSYSSASITPSTGALVLLSVEASTTSGTMSADPTVTGCGLTWELVGRTTSGGQRDVYIFRAMGTPTSGAVTVSFGTTGMGGCNWSVTEYGGTDTSGTNGSGAIVQTRTVSTSALTSISHAFSATVTSGNATHAAVAWIAQETGTPGAGWTALSSTFVATPSNALLAMRALTAQQNVEASWTTSSASHTVAVEIKAATATIPAGSGSGAWAFTGTATGDAPRAGSGTGAWSFTGAGSGTRASQGGGTSAWAYAGSGVGATTFAGAGSGAWAFTGGATGASTRAGTGAGTWAWAGTGGGGLPSALPHVPVTATPIPIPPAAAVLAGDGSSSAALAPTPGTVVLAETSVTATLDGNPATAVLAGDGSSSAALTTTTDTATLHIT